MYEVWVNMNYVAICDDLGNVYKGNVDILADTIKFVVQWNASSWPLLLMKPLVHTRQTWNNAEYLTSMATLYQKIDSLGS